MSPIREALVKVLLLFSSAHILLSEASHRAEPRVRTGEVTPCPREEGTATLLGKGRGYREGSRIGSLNAVKSTTTHPDDPNYSGPSHMQNSPPQHESKTTNGIELEVYSLVICIKSRCGSSCFRHGWASIRLPRLQYAVMTQEQDVCNQHCHSNREGGRAIAVASPWQP